MICAKTQRWLLTSDHTDRPSRDVRQHLASCQACAAVQQRIRQIEARLPTLPVPASSPRRDLFIQQVRSGAAVPKPILSPADRWLRGYQPANRERGLRKAALAVALAASLALFSFTLWNLPKGETQQTQQIDPLVARQQQRDRKLAEVQTPRQRVQVLEGIARNLQEEALQLAQEKRNQDLQVVARFYREVVGDNLVESARQLSKEDRREVLRPISDLLNNAQSAMQRAKGTVPHSTGDSLDIMYVAARDSQNQLDKIMSA